MIDDDLAFGPEFDDASLCSDSELANLLDAIYRHHRHDFRSYAMPSLRRRLGWAMHRLQVQDVHQLWVRLAADPQQFPHFLQYLTVPVSAMFRDPTYFLALRTEVLPLLKSLPATKIWIAGCCTGEEAYSMAIMLHEESMLDNCVIYATDINLIALRTAEQGIFSISSLQDYTQNYQAAGGRNTFSDYYHVAYGNAVFSRFLRDHIVFAEHSLATDAVFSEMQFISCRNVLIYFNRQLQNATLDLFADGLSPGGFLGLGGREKLMAGNRDKRFEHFVQKSKIYRKRSELE
ncbi:MAG TPA: protein-glutamate O-methyltransferase CheR [Dongiaceae bacterium]|nr:protein-glutamate O-methyltransferase CheR [Dongiaceae bacterium]